VSIAPVPPLFLLLQTLIKLEKEDEKAQRRAKAAAWTAELKAAEAEKADRAKREAALEQYWKGVVKANVDDLDERTRREKADHAEREREQRQIREDQMKALADRRAHESAKLQAQVLGAGRRRRNDEESSLRLAPRPFFA
jgi:hypothetical protein